MSYPKNNHKHYHAHVYFDQASRELAKQIRAEAQTRFTVPVGRFHEKLVGPHTMWSFQIAFTCDDFDAVVSWLDKVRNKLSVLVHADTGNDIQDHTQFAYWLGEPVEINLSVL
ncbi:4,5-dioxygenase [Vibrio galatheae]|uniref:4,5-dioxygenase n=1 Tax=Vibrio galatheae TaxID=579748 RepID=A0A0F4NQ06_9VIBR|nr:DOPA 4,5-dioxygenase family protein [Vibrio galatheae]KJY84918.1 4,5-dioxygenase [Vibrio galatheae]